MEEQKFQIPKSWTEMLDNFGISDPRLRLMAEMMGKQEAENSQNQPDIEEKLAKKKRALARIEGLVRENKALRESNQSLQERLDLLASALGACPDCWGEEQDCASCQGKGIPGNFLPERDAFLTIILPAVRTVQRFRQRGKSSGAAGSTERS